MSLSEAKQCGFQSCCLKTLIEKRLIIVEFDNADKKNACICYLLYSVALQI